MPLLNERIKKRYKVNLPDQLMECEVNYRRLLRLLRDTPLLEVGHSRHYIVGNNPASESVIELTVVEQTRYTTVVHIVQFCALQNTRACVKSSTREKQSDVGALCLKSRQIVYRGDVRLYHDADMAEVVKCQRYNKFEPRYEYPNINMHQIDEKAQMNRFLGELLAHCLNHGRVSESVVNIPGKNGLKPSDLNHDLNVVASKIGQSCDQNVEQQDDKNDKSNELLSL